MADIKSEATLNRPGKSYALKKIRCPAQVRQHQSRVNPRTVTKPPLAYSGLGLSLGARNAHDVISGRPKYHEAMKKVRNTILHFRKTAHGTTRSYRRVWFDSFTDASLVGSR